MKRVLLTLVVLAGYAFAIPMSATCPYDGSYAYFDHTVGYGRNQVCWYSHQAWDAQAGRYVKHQFYIPCPTQ
jgi:hypothetical protein